MEKEFTIRKAKISDIEDLVRLRRVMFESMGFDNQDQLNSADKAAKSYFKHSIEKNEFYGWLAVSGKDEIIGTGGLVIDQHPPGPANLSGKIGYIMNLVTDPKYRRKGIARKIMLSMLNWLRETDITLSSLHASKDGKSLYDEIGYLETNEMRLKLDENRNKLDNLLVSL